MLETSVSALTLVGAPALLTNAASVLLMSTANRLGRTVTRARELAGEIETCEKAGTVPPGLFRQLDLAERRVLITVRAMTANYIALGCFAAGTLAALLGALAASAGDGVSLTMVIATTVVTGGTGVVAMIAGSVMLVHESNLAYRLLKFEADKVREKWRELW